MTSDPSSPGGPAGLATSEPASGAGAAGRESGGGEGTAGDSRAAGRQSPSDESDAPAEGAETTRPKARELTDPRELRALTHPVRFALLEVLNLHDALTATEAGELIGESPTTCSFHLRQLAKYGFVEEAGDAPGRRRPWRLAVRQMNFSAMGGDAEMSAASAALENLLIERWMARFSDWQRVRSSYPESWQAAATAAEFLVHLTPEELAELQAEMLRLVDRFAPRNEDAALRPEGARPVEVVIFGHPIRP